MPDHQKGKVEQLNPEIFEAEPNQRIMDMQAGTIMSHPSEIWPESYAKFEKGIVFRFGKYCGELTSIFSAVINDTVMTVVNRSISIQDMLEDCFPKLTRLLAYFLPKKVRRDCFEPTREEILEDYYHTRNDPQYAGRFIRTWLLFCYLFRTGVLWLVCLMLWLGDSVVHRVLRVMPASFQSWWTGRPNSSA